MRRAIIASLAFLLTVMPISIDSKKILKSSPTLNTCQLPIPTLNPEQRIELCE
ncbi:MAG: hypothetical protein ACJASU_001655 [Cognaticolwellia sp.]|jgi:hypothetical protein